MTDLTESDILSLKEEKILCMNHLIPLKDALDTLTRLKNESLEEYHQWKSRYEAADMQLALTTKLTVVKRGDGKKEPNIDINGLLKDKEKIKKFIKLLQKEGYKLE